MDVRTYVNLLVPYGLSDCTFQCMEHFHFKPPDFGDPENELKSSFPLFEVKVQNHRLKSYKIYICPKITFFFDE